MRLLLIEADPQVRAQRTDDLRRAGYDPAPYATAAVAWAAYLNDPFPFVVLPIDPPDETGLRLCRDIRNHDAGTDTAIIVTTPRSDAATLTAIVDAGADDFVASPVELPVLETSLGLASRRRQREIARRKSNVQR